MVEKLKGLGWWVVGFSFLVLTFLVVAFFLDGISWLMENYYDLIGIINGWVFGLIIVLIVLSIFPKIRTYTGSGITLATLIWGAIFWLFSLFITYQLWGLLGVIIGIMFFGLGVFATAFLALIFDGQTSVAFFMLLNLIIIYGIRMLGVWIISKQKLETIEYDNIQSNT